MPFGLDFPVAAEQPQPWNLEFRTSCLYRPSERGDGTDQRDLGFALVLLASKECVSVERTTSQALALEPLAEWIQAVDRWGARLSRRFRRKRAAGTALAAGLTVLIPERDNVAELSVCLETVREAAGRWSEPIEIVVCANGLHASHYALLRHAHPEVRWQFHAKPLGFAAAIHAGLRQARSDWVYLLNNDVALDPDAFRALASWRDPMTFAVASQVVLKDATRFPEETNWSTLFVEDGLAAIHDWIPRSSRVAANFYAGGGASLFQTRMLRRFLKPRVYAPFYWEDVEWGWRARKLGYRSLFCPDSVAHHRQRATISRFYSAEEVDRVVQRNRFLFQLRNFTTAGSRERVLDEIARAPAPVAGYFLTGAARREIACGRLWNHVAPIRDEEVLEQWNRPVSTFEEERPGRVVPGK